MIVQKIFKDNICLLSGCQRSGKSLLTAILPSLKKIEIINKEPILGTIFSMNQTGELNNKVSNYLLSFILSNVNYSNFLGRKINLKRSDETSIYNLLNHKYHLNKINSKKKIDLKKIKNKGTIIYDIHNIFLNISLWTHLNKNIKIINVERHPVNLIYSWYKKGFGNFKHSPISQILLYKYKKKLVPYYALKWKNKYIKMAEMDRIINIIYELIKRSDLEYKKFKYKKKILRLKYENILDNPLNTLKKVDKFLNYKSKIFFSRYSNKVDTKKRVSKSIILKKLSYIQKKTSKDSHKKIHELINLYSRYNF